jgi:hypothetical protein
LRLGRFAWIASMMLSHTNSPIFVLFRTVLTHFTHLSRSAFTARRMAERMIRADAALSCNGLPSQST